MSQQREPKGTSVGGQFASDSNPESSLILVDEPTVKVIEICLQCGRGIWGTGEGFVNRVPATRGRLDGFVCYDCDQSNSDDDDAPEFDFDTFEKRILALVDVPEGFRDLSREILLWEVRYKQAYSERADCSDEQILSYKQDMIDAQEELINRLMRSYKETIADESSFDVETAIAERVVSLVKIRRRYERGGDTLERFEDKSEHVHALVRDYYRSGRYPVGFDDELGTAYDNESREFVDANCDALVKIAGFDFRRFGSND